MLTISSTSDIESTTSPPEVADFLEDLMGTVGVGICSGEGGCARPGVAFLGHCLGVPCCLCDWLSFTETDLPFAIILADWGVSVKTLERFPLVAGIRTLGVAFRRLMICLGSREDPPGVLTFVIFIGEAF